MKRKLIDAPSSYAITVAEAKAHLHVDSTDDDSYITSLIAVATEAVQNYSGWQLMDAVYEIAIDYFPDYEIEILPHPYYDPRDNPLILKYYNTSNVLTTLFENAHYIIDDYVIPNKIVPLDVWPQTYDKPNAVIIEFHAGHGDSLNVPAVLKQAMLLMMLEQVMALCPQGGKP